MAIALDVQQYGASDATTTTVGITVGNNVDRILVALISIGNSTGASQVDTVKFNTTESFTRAVTILDSGVDEACDIWYLLNPTATTADVVVDYAGSTSPDAAVNVVSLYGVHQTSPIGNRGADSKTGAGGTNHPVVVTTTGTDNSWVLGVAIKNNGGVTGATPDGGTNEWQDAIGGSGAGDYLHLSGYVSTTSAGNYSMGWTEGSADAWAMLCAEIKSSGAVTVAVNKSDNITLTEGPNSGIPQLALVDNAIPNGGIGDTTLSPGWKRGVKIYTP